MLDIAVDRRYFNRLDTEMGSRGVAWPKTAAGPSKHTCGSADGAASISSHHVVLDCIPIAALYAVHCLIITVLGGERWDSLCGWLYLACDFTVIEHSCQ